MIGKLATAMFIVFIMIPLLILGFALIGHLLVQTYFILKSDIEELSKNEKR